MYEDRAPGIPHRSVVVICTAIVAEYEAVRRHLNGPITEWEDARGSLYEIGSVPGKDGDWRVVLAQAGVGNTAAGLHVERAISNFSPRVLLFVGVAGGRKDVRLGDVVVADAIYDYESGKESPQGYFPRIKTQAPAYGLVQRAIAVARESAWQARIRPSCGEPRPSAVVKPIAAGSKVVAHSRSITAKLLDDYCSDAVAVEMEGYGALQGAYINAEVEGLVIRGISDLLTGKDEAADALWQPRAAEHAASFAFELLAKMSVRPARGSSALSDSALIASLGDRPDGGRSASGAVHPGEEDAAWRAHATADQETGSKLFGADTLIESVARWVAGEDDDWVVSLGGAGGIGKTAIAYQVAEQCAHDRRFSRVAWAATGTRFSFNSGRASMSSRAWTDVVKTIGDQLDFDLGISPDMYESELRDRMRGLSPHERVLTVIDNLETVEDADIVTLRLRDLGLVKPHKVIITTRHPILTQPSSVVRNVILAPLRDEHSAQLVRHEGRSHPDLDDASIESIKPILDATDNYPFHIKLVVRRFVSLGLPMDRIVSEMRMRTNRLAGRSLGDEVYDHLYLPSLRELERLCGAAAQSVLSAFCRYGTATSFTYDQLWKRSRIGDRLTFDRALGHACQLTLLRPFDQHRKFLMHSLLREFRCRGMQDPASAAQRKR
jgi:nucleoside phosphorylase